MAAHPAGNKCSHCRRFRGELLELLLSIQQTPAQMAETLRDVQHECETHALLLRTTLQNLLIRDDVKLSDAASQLVQDAYQETQELQRIAALKPKPI